MSKLYKNMVEILKPGETDKFKLEKFGVTSSDFRGLLSGVPEGEYVRLIDKQCGIWNSVVMSNTPMELRTNTEFVLKAHGDVLIAGLGIGLVPLAIQDKPDVNSITIVEKEEEIIKLIEPQLNLNRKVSVIEEDIYMYRPDKLFDCIYFDIWSYVNSDVYKDMLFLKDGFRRYLKPVKESPNHYIKCWAETEARYNMELR